MSQNLVSSISFSQCKTLLLWYAQCPSAQTLSCSNTGFKISHSELLHLSWHSKYRILMGCLTFSHKSIKNKPILQICKIEQIRKVIIYWPVPSKIILWNLKATYIFKKPLTFYDLEGLKSLTSTIWTQTMPSVPYCSANHLTLILQFTPKSSISLQILSPKLSSLYTHETQYAEWQNLVIQSISALPKMCSNKIKLCLNHIHSLLRGWFKDLLKTQHKFWASKGLTWKLWWVYLQITVPCVHTCRECGPTPDPPGVSFID